jgi:hypothetical protein
VNAMTNLYKPEDYDLDELICYTLEIRILS